jgi:VanZ family protein
MSLQRIMSRLVKDWPILSWWLLFALFSYALLSPQSPKINAALLPSTIGFWAGKGIHLFGYALFSVLIALVARRGWSQGGHWVLLLGHAMLTEWLQTWVPGRTGNPEDVVINLCGVLLGFTLVVLLFRPSRAEQPA